MGPSAHQAGQGGTQGLALAAQAIPQLSCVWLYPWERAGSAHLPNPLFFTLLVPCRVSVWGHHSPGHPLAPKQDRCLRLCSPPIPGSWDLGTALSEGLLQGYRSG